MYPNGFPSSANMRFTLVVLRYPTIGWAAVKYGTCTHVPLRMTFGHPLTFHLAPSLDLNFNFGL